MRRKSRVNSPEWCDRHGHLNAIAKAALDAVDPFETVKHHLKSLDRLITIGPHELLLEEDARIYVVGAGKAGVAMARAVEQILKDKIHAGLVSVPDLPTEKLSKIQLSQGGHPLPTGGSIQAGERIRTMLQDVNEQDLVLVLISGGGSALLELPVEGLNLSDLQTMNDLLIKSGAPIQEINIVRRQLSRIKGGGLAHLAAPAHTFALILSDVVGDSLEAIASGPTVPSTTGVKDVWKVLERYNLRERLPENVINALKNSTNLEPEYSGLSKDRLTNIIIGSNKVAAKAAVAHSSQIGFEGILLTTELQGEAREVGRSIAALVKAVNKFVSGAAPSVCMVLGGETTVTVHGSGSGGRNQELALAAAIELENTQNIAVMTLATDGVDGPTPSAGAMIDGETISKARELNLPAQSFLDNHDSFTFFHAIEDTVILGPTGTNVNDLVFCLVYSA
jgi:glycerate 2-kinase